MPKKQQTETATAVIEEKIRYELLPLKDLVASTTNPRRSFDQQKLEDLAASIARKGVIQGIVVRQHPDQADKYEIVTGERRYRASLLAGKQTIPGTVRDLSDDEVIELQITENLQREDVDPLDEAASLRYYLKHFPAYDVRSLAQKLGKSEVYVYTRMKLVDLIPYWQDALRHNQITVTHALHLSKLTAEQQLALTERTGYGWLLFKEWHQDPRQIQYDSAKSFALAIQRAFFTKLAKVPFALDDADLLPSAGSCTACPKRTGNNPVLFQELAQEDTCTDGGCLQRKCRAFAERLAQQLVDQGEDAVIISTEYGQQQGVVGPAKYRILDDEDAAPEHTTVCKGVVLDGQRAGQVIRIAVRKEQEDYGESSAEREANWKREQQERALNERVDAVLARKMVPLIHEKIMRCYSTEGELPAMLLSNLLERAFPYNVDVELVKLLKLVFNWPEPSWQRDTYSSNKHRTYIEDCLAGMSTADALSALILITIESNRNDLPSLAEHAGFNWQSERQQLWITEHEKLRSKAKQTSSED